MYTALCRGNAG